MLLVVLDGISRVAGWPVTSELMVEGLRRDPTLGSVLLMAISLAGTTPIGEELVFRGLLYGWIESRWGSMVALVVSSLAFAGAHYEPAHILLVLPLGFLFGWLRRRTNSLVPSLASHVVNNGFAVLSAAFLGG